MVDSGQPQILVRVCTLFRPTELLEAVEHPSLRMSICVSVIRMWNKQVVRGNCKIIHVVESKRSG